MLRWSLFFSLKGTSKHPVPAICKPNFNDYFPSAYNTLVNFLSEFLYVIFANYSPEVFLLGWILKQPDIEKLQEK